MKKHVIQYELEEIKCGEVVDTNYHEDYFDVEEVDEYGPDDEDKESDYLSLSLWDEEGFGTDEECFEE